MKANVLTPVYYSAVTGFPLSATRVEKKYKMLFLDIGLAQAAHSIAPEVLLHENLMLINRGALTEQFVGQHLLTLQPSYEKTELYYWQRDAKNSQAEIDYLLPVHDAIIPLEVKSGAAGRLKSMHLYLESHPKTPLGVKLSLDAFDPSKKIWTVPLYLLEQLPRLILEREK